MNCNENCHAHKHTHISIFRMKLSYNLELLQTSIMYH